MLGTNEWDPLKKVIVGIADDATIPPLDISHGIECAMLPGRQQRTLGGGFHCVTLDLLRA
jgi:hypothetical protein